jgi:hypothetical protein
MFLLFKLRELMETEEKELKLMNNKNLKEANKKNSESVKKFLSFYEKRMESVLKDNMILTEEAFRKHHNTIKEETFDLFSNTCNCGELEFIEIFEINLQQSISKSKRKFKKIFSEEVVKFETRFDEEINNCFEYYKDVMSTLLDFMKKDEFKMKHKEFKAKAVDSLKSKLIIRDEEFMNKQMAKLDDKIENEFKENFLANNKDTEKRVEVEVKLNNAKTDLDLANRRLIEEFMLYAEMVLKSSLNFLQEKIDENINAFSGSENFEEVNKSIKDNTIQFFEQRCIIKDTNILNPYLIHLENEIDKAFVTLNRNFETKNQELNDFYNNTIEQAINKCFVVFENFYR